MAPPQSPQAFPKSGGPLGSTGSSAPPPGHPAERRARRVTENRFGRLREENPGRKTETYRRALKRLGGGAGWQATEDRRRDSGRRTNAKPYRGEPARALRDGEGGVRPPVLPPGKGAEGVCPRRPATRPHLAVAAAAPAWLGTHRLRREVRSLPERAGELFSSATTRANRFKRRLRAGGRAPFQATPPASRGGAKGKAPSAAIGQIPAFESLPALADWLGVGRAFLLLAA